MSASASTPTTCRLSTTLQYVSASTPSIQRSTIPTREELLDVIHAPNNATVQLWDASPVALCAKLKLSLPTRFTTPATSVLDWHICQMASVYAHQTQSRRQTIVYATQAPPSIPTNTATRSVLCVLQSVTALQSLGAISANHRHTDRCTCRGDIMYVHVPHLTLNCRGSAAYACLLGRWMQMAIVLATS